MKTKIHPHPIQFLARLCILLIVLSGCAPSPAKEAAKASETQAPAAGTYWPTKGWRTSTPEEQGMEAGKLTQMLEAIQEQKLGLHSLLVIRHGYLVSETYFGSYQQDTRHELYSVTKSFISTLIGIALDKGAIDSTSHRVVDFFPGQTFASLDEQKRAMTLEDVLTMRTGLDWDEGDIAYHELYISPDWVQHMLDMPMVAAPGSQFNYCSGCSHLLSAILQQTTGMNPRDFAEKNLFKPLGISNARWESNPAGIPIGGWGLQLTPREMAKLGYLFLHNGQWDGQQIVSAGWVEIATRSHTGTGGSRGYGYQWWTVPSLGAYTALGLFGQTIMVIPGSDLVIVTTAQMENHDKIFQLIEQYIVPAVQRSP
jgi:CubicO group peptidase (beta-lactamase class C family)